MELRYRKSVKLAPGVKLNIGKKSTGISVGVKGARFSVNSKGRVTRSVGIPGTGISYTKSTSLKSKKKQSRSKKKTSKLQAFLNSAIPDEAKDNSNSISAPVSNTTENTERTGHLGSKTKQELYHIDTAETQQGRSSQNKAGGIGEQRRKVRHGANAHKDQGRVNTGFYAEIQEVDQTGTEHGAGSVRQPAGHQVDKLVNTGVMHSQVGAGNIGQQHTEGNGDHQQRLKALFDTQIQENKSNHQHDSVFPAAVRCEEIGVTGVRNDLYTDLPHPS